jgi:putative hemolysin
MNKYVSTGLGVTIIILVAIIIAGAFYFFGQKENLFSAPIASIAPVNNSPKACTQEAKICPDGSSVGRTGNNCEFSKCPSDNAQIANPASVYCEKNGGKSDIRTGSDGGQVGYCKFSDGTECEEWQYFRQECVPGGIIYTNTDYGFQVTLPKGWEKYQVSVQRDKGDDKHTYFYFMLPTSDKSWIGSYNKNTGKSIAGMVDIFVITANDLATWNKDLNSTECKENPNPSCPYEGSVVAKNNQYVFDAGYGNGLLPPDVEKFRSAKSAQEFLNGKFKLLP